MRMVPSRQKSRTTPSTLGAARWQMPAPLLPYQGILKHLGVVAMTLGLGVNVVSACGRQTPSVPENIFGPDNRETPPDEYPYKAVGRIDSGCTGTLIGKKLVLTAAHCVIDGKTGTVKPSLTYFHPNLRGGKSAENIWIDYAWLGTTKPEDDREHDFAVLRLEKPISNTYGSLGTLSTPIATALPYTTNLVGYSADRNSGDDPSLHRGCYIMEIVDGKLYHECDGAAGVSGGPMLNQINGNWYITAMTVSEYRQGADSSVTRGSYSRDYANVAVPASAFAASVQELLKTTDVDVAALPMAGITETANPNQRPAPATPPPQSPNLPYSASQLLAQNFLALRGQQLRMLVNNMYADTQAMNRIAVQYGSQNFQHLTANCISASSGMDSAFSKALTQDAAAYDAAAIYSAYGTLKTAAGSLQSALSTAGSEPVYATFSPPAQHYLWIVTQLELNLFSR